jgi:hypothetical protein
MGESKIIRRGGAGAAERTVSPTINFVSKLDTQITVTFTNNDTEECEIYYTLTQFTDNKVLVNANETSSSVTFTGLDPDTDYDIFAYAIVTNPLLKKIKSEIVFVTIRTQEFIRVFIQASGGDVYTYEEDNSFYKAHVFNSSGNFVVSSLGNLPELNQVDYLVVAGGGSGAPGSPNPGIRWGGSGGAGGFRTSLNRTIETGNVDTGYTNGIENLSFNLGVNQFTGFVLEINNESRVISSNTETRIFAYPDFTFAPNNTMTYAIKTKSGRLSAPENKITVNAQSYSVSIGAGGASPGLSWGQGNPGVASSALGISSSGGGAGGTAGSGGSGGSGGGGGGGASGGSGIAGQGHGGRSRGIDSSANGGGAGSGDASFDGFGLANTLAPFNATTGFLKDGKLIFADGGGRFTSRGFGSGGISAGTNGATSGIANTGSGGGGAQQSNPGNGGSGVVIIRYEVGEL